MKKDSKGNQAKYVELNLSPQTVKKTILLQTKSMI